MILFAMITLIIVFSLFNLFSFLVGRLFFSHFLYYRTLVVNNKITKIATNSMITPLIFCIPFGAFILSFIFSSENSWQRGALKIAVNAGIVITVLYIFKRLTSLYFGHSAIAI